EPLAQADEDPADPRRPRHQDDLPGQCRTDRHALPHRNHVRPDLRGGSLQALAAQRAYHAAPWRTLPPGGFRLRSAVSDGSSPDLIEGRPRKVPALVLRIDRKSVV